MNPIQFSKAALICVLFASSAHAVSIDWVNVGNPGNPADATGYGAVPYEYRIGKYEITNAQYTEFLNAVGRTDAKGLLFPTSMILGSRSGIVRSGTPGNLTYSVKPTAIGQGPNGSDYSFADKPVFYVSLLNAMRFVNWLENGQPTGPQNRMTTEDGVYRVGNGTTEVRKPNARYFLPNEDEWYKAAYHKNDGVTANYWTYPTGTDAPPDHNLPSSDTGNSANFYHDGTFTTGNTLYPLTDVGAYLLSSSAYGTHDQGGNVAEWTESHEVGSRFHATRGGTWSYSIAYLASTSRTNAAAFFDGEPIQGFRVASIPELGAINLMMIGAIVFGLTVRRPSRAWSCC